MMNEARRDDVDVDGKQEKDGRNLSRPNQALLGRRWEAGLVHCTTD